MVKNLILSIVLISLGAGCKKQYGCTDGYAVNFDADAEISNHSCFYHEVVFFKIYDWRMEDFIENDIGSLRVFFNDEFMVKYDTDPTVPHFKVDFTSFEKRRDIKLLIMDNKDSVIRDGRFRMSGNNEEKVIQL